MRTQVAILLQYSYPTVGTIVRPYCGVPKPFPLERSLGSSALSDSGNAFDRNHAAIFHGSLVRPYIQGNQIQEHLPDMLPEPKSILQLHKSLANFA